MALHLLFHTVEWMFYILGRFVAGLLMTQKSALVFPQTPSSQKVETFPIGSVIDFEKWLRTWLAPTKAWESFEEPGVESTALSNVHP